MSMEKVLRHKAICDELNKLYEKKNHDYGDSFHQTFVEEGLAMTRIRLGDKFSRFKTLSRITCTDSDHFGNGWRGGLHALCLWEAG